MASCFCGVAGDGVFAAPRRHNFVLGAAKTPTPATQLGV